MTEPKPDLIVYDFRNAPEELRELSIAGGDEEWIIVAHKDAKRLPWWFYKPEDFDLADEEREFGTCYGSEWVTNFGGEADFFALPDGRLVAITSH